ncbi:hypothetical protein OCF61_13650 [Bacillus cereus]|nr:hypothetical protein [Bacillus cereus]
MQNILKKIDLFCQTGFKNSDLMEKILMEYQALHSKNKAEVEYKMYVIYRGKFDALFCSNQFSQAIYWLEKTRIHPRYEGELEDNKRQILIKGIKNYFIEFLNSQDEIFLNKGKKLKSELDYLGKDTILQDEIYKEVVALERAIEENNIITEVSLKLPLSMKEATIKPLIVQINDFVANVDYVTSNVGDSNGLFVTKEYDKEGQMQLTTWTIQFNTYIKYEELVKIEKKYNISVLDEAICQVINTVINNYRTVSQEYWIKNIYPHMIQSKGIKYIAEGTPFINIISLDNGVYTFSSEKEKVKFPQILKQDTVALYALLLLDAQSYLLSGDFRESVLSLNSAFENFIYTVVCPLIVEKSNGELDQKFYHQIPSYNEFDFKDYMNEEQYQSALNDGIIKEISISTFTIIKILYNYCEELSSIISKKKMNKLIYGIRKNRNDFIHGNKVSIPTSYNEVSKQIEGFKKFKDIIFNLINANSKTSMVR